MSKPRATITAVSHYVPDKVLTNADLEKRVDTTDEWIRQRTGMDPGRLRKISPQLERIEDQLSDARAARIYRPGLANENKDDDENEGGEPDANSLRIQHA